MVKNSDPGHWFWRGVQSAVFYYVSCTPCLDRKYKKRRRREAKAAEQQVITTQPGVIQQPRAFQTNVQWIEELILGPGPPKPYKGDLILRSFRKKGELPTPPSTPSSDSAPKPKMERRFSQAMDNVKESLWNSIHPEKWNFKRYDRDDEILWGLGDKMTKMWDRVTSASNQEDAIQGRKRAHTSESDRYDYTRGEFPAVNELHPPVVSQLPATKEEAAWMLLPPPKAAVMAGKERPTADTLPRKPMCVIGRPPQENKPPDIQREDSDMTWNSSDADDLEEELSMHYRHQSEPAPRIRLPPRAVSADLYIPKTRPIDAIPMDLFAKADGATTSISRPSSWQFHYIIPSQ